MLNTQSHVCYSILLTYLYINKGILFAQYKFQHVCVDCVYFVNLLLYIWFYGCVTFCSKLFRIVINKFKCWQSLCIILHINLSKIFNRAFDKS